MNLHDVMLDLATALGGITGLRVYPFWAESVQPPAAVVAWPDPYVFDTTMGRGVDSATFPVVVLVGKVDVRSASEALGAYCNGSGVRSIKAVVEAFDADSYGEAVVESVEFAATSVAGVEYLAATFNIGITGNGA